MEGLRILELGYLGSGGVGARNFISIPHLLVLINISLWVEYKLSSRVSGR
jgi:hypothetical protein